MNAPEQNSQAHAQPSAEQLLSLLSQKREFDWRQYWAVLWRRKWWVLIPIVLLTGASIAVALLFIRPIYEASATIQVLPSRLQRSMREVTPGVSNAVDYRELQKKILNTPNLLQLIQRLELRKDALANETAKTLHAQAKWLPYDEVLERVLLEMLRENLAVQMNPGAQLFQITARNESPRMAYRLVKSLTEIFVDESKKNELRGIRGVMEFSNEQLEIYAQKVRDTEGKLQALKQRQASDQVQKIGLDANSVLQLRQLISTSESAIAERQRKLADLQSGLGLPGIPQLWEREAPLQQVKSKIEAKMADFKRSTIAAGLRTDAELTLDSEVNALRQEYHQLLDAAVTRAFPTLAEELHGAMIEYQLGQIDLYILRARAAVANDLLQRFAQMSTAAPADEIELRRLEAELAQNRRIYEVFLEQSRGSQIEEALQNSDADFKYSVIEAASMPVAPVGGSKRVFVLGAFGVSVILGFSLVIVLELSDQSIRNVKDAEQLLGAPVWGVIPRIGASFEQWQSDLEKIYRGGEKDAASRTVHNPGPSTGSRAQTGAEASAPPPLARVNSIKTSQQEFQIRSGNPPKVLRRTTAPSAEKKAGASPSRATKLNPAPELLFQPKPRGAEPHKAETASVNAPDSQNGAADRAPAAPPEEQDQWIV
jgi:uncharacterized protein involved in exopolysaccharide biosynthesis